MFIHNSTIFMMKKLNSNDCTVGLTELILTRSFTYANIFRQRCQQINHSMGVRIKHNFRRVICTVVFFLCFCQLLLFSTSYNGWVPFSSMSISRASVCDPRDTSLVLALLLSLVLAPVRMGSQYSVQKLLRNRLSPSLLRRDLCGMNQGLPFVLQTMQRL